MSNGRFQIQMLVVSNDIYASLLMLFSTFLYSLQNADARFSGNIFGFWTMCVFRGIVGSFVCALLLCIETRKQKLSIVPHRNLKFLVIRSILGGGAIITSFYAIMKCDLSTTTIITSTSSLWTALIGYMISPSKYKWGIGDLMIALWCIGGVVIISVSNKQETHYYIGVISALASAIFQSCVNLTIKRLDDENPAWVSLWGTMGSVILGFPGMIYEVFKHNIDFKHADPIEWVSLGTTGVLSALAQYYKTFSIQLAGSMSVLILRYTDVIFSVLWDIFIFKETLKWRVIVGMVVVFSGCMTKFLLDVYQSRQTNQSLPTLRT